MSESPRKPRSALVMGLIALAAAASAALVALAAGPHWLRPVGRFHGWDITSERWNATFALTDASGRGVTPADWKGKAVLLAFGYTHCPDACPATLATLAEVRRLMGKDAPRLQVLFVTVDPERDGAQFLGRYVQAFDPTFVGLRGTDTQTRAAATAFRAYYEISRQQGEVLVSHTVNTYLMDPGGCVRDVLPNSLSARDIAEDVKTVLASKQNCRPGSV